MIINYKIIIKLLYHSEIYDSIYCRKRVDNFVKEYLLFTKFNLCTLKE